MDQEKRRTVIRLLETPIFKIINNNEIKAERTTFSGNIFVDTRTSPIDREIITGRQTLVTNQIWKRFGLFSFCARSSARKRWKGSKCILLVHVGVFSGTEIEVKNEKVFRVWGLSFADTRVSWREKSSTPAHTPKMWTLLAGYKLVCSKADDIAGFVWSEGRFM